MQPMCVQAVEWKKRLLGVWTSRVTGHHRMIAPQQG
jgi:hypothetical protein